MHAHTAFATTAPKAGEPADVPDRVHLVQHVMGTAIGVDIRRWRAGSPSDDEARELVDRVVARLRAVDDRFSPWKPASEVSRLQRGELREHDASAELRDVLALCDELARTSGGAFDARRWRTDGAVDPTGLVKGWAIDEAARLLEDAAVRDFAINAGGDIVVAGEPTQGRAWRVGIRHPEESHAVAAVLALHDRAVATSGGYERGDHIRDPRTGRTAPAELLAVTVVGPSILWADAYATAAFVMGREGLAWVARHPGYDAWAVTADRRATWTAGLDGYLDRRG